ncbi:MAG: 4Fe-4S dicluster domain-containing protein [Chlorobi bacterium]|nr:4Fe-4S dicluster domain-containing protein [Chlorobiota bacterium]
MHEITLLSGKGGTGKTTVAAALASISRDAVFCDADVDAADMHLILKPEILEEHRFESNWVAKIDDDNCTRCSKCVEYCRFDAIHYKPFGGLEINPFQCEGCRLCERICPVGAIHSEKSNNNFWYVSKTRFGTLVHAKMGAGEENSGKLVTEVRKKAMEIAKSTGARFVITDGPPGIGCPVISALTGTHKVLMVIEPTKSGLHDIKRLVDLALNFEPEMYAVINKYDINTGVTNEIEKYLNENSIKLLARIPFDTAMVEAMLKEKTMVEYQPASPISKIIEEIWEVITKTEYVEIEG